MVFSSIQAYLDSSNWQQVPPNNYNQLTGASTNEANSNHILHSQPQPQPQPPSSNGTGGGSSVRPGSMVDRARLANVAIPEAPLKCPRCESTNTKFCYFNNYSLTQPRHFCKTCRRYWTRGGALRNVPVGGGCRRNRRSKSSNNNNNNNNSNSNNNNNGLTVSGNTSTISAILSSNYGGQHESILSQILSPVRLMGPTCNNFGDIIAGENNYGEFRSSNSGNLEDSLNSASGFYSISSALASQFSAVKVEENHPYKWVNLNGNSSPWTDLSTLGASSR